MFLKQHQIKHTIVNQPIKPQYKKTGYGKKNTNTNRTTLNTQYSTDKHQLTQHDKTNTIHKHTTLETQY